MCVVCITTNLREHLEENKKNSNVLKSADTTQTLDFIAEIWQIKLVFLCLSSSNKRGLMHFSQGACARRDIILSTDTQITLIALPMEELLARSSNSLNLHSKSCSASAGHLHVLLSVESWKLQSSCSDVKLFQTDHISQDLLDHMAEKHGGTRSVF